jgi:hypothetical protein
MKPIQRMATRGLLPKRLANCRIPMFQACINVRMTKRPWRGKKIKNENKLLTITAPGDCVSVDQMESTTPGLIAQIKGIPTNSKIPCGNSICRSLKVIFGMYISRRQLMPKKCLKQSMPLNSLHFHVEFK